MFPHLQQRLNDFRQQSRVQAGSLITSVFGDAVLPRGGSLWLGSLIGLLEPLGLNERLVRTSVFRLAKEGWLQAQAQGRRTDYQLTPTGQRRFEEASRQIYAAESPLWDRRWRLIMVVGELPARRREQLRRALFWQGFGDLATGCFVHPGADLNAAFDALLTDGMGDLVPNLISLVAANPRVGDSATDDDIVRRAWNLDRLAADYTAFVQQYQPMLDELRSTSIEHMQGVEAFLARTLLIHDYRRLLLRDPELPEVLLPTAWPGHAARALCQEIYRRLLSDSEQFLDQALQLANGTVPPASALLHQRFQGRDVLAGVA
ncbi:MAG: hypothetical protein RLZZ591_2374 [Pseudomonadota bacterium]|jgi:phenylacetic acid degradation operon negative regulatory protein